jgi:hypothetical protein
MSWRDPGVFALAVAACIGSAPAFALEPSINYALHCMGCHTPDGSEVPDRVPAIRTTLLPFSRMSDGRKYLVQVPGAAQSTLSNAELADLLNWMIENLSSADGSRSFTRYTEKEVAEYRGHALIAVRAARERLLAQAGPLAPVAK